MVFSCCFHKNLTETSSRAPANINRTGRPTVNSLLPTLRFRLTFISYANPVGRKTFVTGFNVQPSSFVSLLLCQSLRRGVFLSFSLCLTTLLHLVGGRCEKIKLTIPVVSDNRVKYNDNTSLIYQMWCNDNMDGRVSH